MASPKIGTLRAEGWTDNDPWSHQLMRYAAESVMAYTPKGYAAVLGLFGARRWHGRWWFLTRVLEACRKVSLWWMNEADAVGMRALSNNPTGSTNTFLKQRDPYTAGMKAVWDHDFMPALEVVYRMGGPEAVAELLNPRTDAEIAAVALKGLP